MSGFKMQTPVSQLIRTGKGGGGVDERKTRDSFRKEKDLEEDRKLGLEPACVDVDSGRDINPHIPQFITQTPWYVPTDGPTLKHQRPHWERQQEVDSGVNDWYKRGQQEAPQRRLKFKPGSCENCGATTHKKRDCFERPRKVGAKFTNADIAADDHLQPKVRLTNWEAKRDRWNGYDNTAYSEVIKEHEKQEEVRKMIKAERLKEEKAAADAAKAEKAEENSADEGEEEKAGSQGEGGGDDDEDLYAESAALPTKVEEDATTKMTVRNLRIREDTAKYLYNLNENAPYYDPKSRSMRENPLAGIKGKEQEAAKFSGENFVRYSGEVVAANEAQVFAWSARCQGIDVHALAEPTKLEQLQKDFKEETRDVKQETKKKLLEKYGGGEHLEAIPKELLLAQSESYVEYSRKGTVIKGEERPAIKSRYEEDVYPKNHTSVFGSYWANGRWGFRCCHSFVKQSYCIGEQGYAVSDEMAALPSVAKKAAEAMKDEPEAAKEKDAVKAEEGGGEVKKEESSSSSSSSSSESSSDSEDSEEEKEREKKKKEAEAEEEKRRAEREARKRDRRREKRKRRAEKMGGKRKRKRHASSSSESNSANSSESEKEEDNTEDAKLQREVAKALKEEKRARKEAKKNERDRKYNTTYEFKKPTELETEAYKLTKVHAADPMAKYIEEKRNK